MKRPSTHSARLLIQSIAHFGLLMALLLAGFSTVVAAQTTGLLTPLWSAPQGLDQSEEASLWMRQWQEQLNAKAPGCAPSGMPPINNRDPARAFAVNWKNLPPSERQTLFLQEPIASTFAVLVKRSDACTWAFFAGRIHPFALRTWVSPYPNTLLPDLSGDDQVFVIIQDPKAIRPWVRMTSEAAFQRETLLVWMMLAAFCAVLILVIGVVLSFSSKSRVVTAYTLYVLAFIGWMLQNFGVGFAWLPSLFPASTFGLLQAVSVAGVVTGIGWTILEFLAIKGIYRMLFGGVLVASVCGFLLSIWWPSTYRFGSLALTVAAILALVQLVARLKEPEPAMRLFALGLGATILGGGTQALSVVLAGSEGSRIAVYSFAVGSFTQAMLWLAAITTRLRAERTQLMNWRQDELEQQISRATRELVIKKEVAEDATRAKSDFLAAASHDLRQPTHALGLLITRMGQFDMAPDMRQVHKSLQSSVHAIQDLLDDLMDYTRLESGTEQVHQRPVALSTVLAPLQDALGPMAAAKGLRLQILPTRLWGISDPSLLKRMVMNLALNAIRYTKEGTVLVACRLTQNAQKINIQVWDSGIGIAESDHQRIFKEFYQVGNAARDRGKGIGLGLSIVQRSAELLGHTMALRSSLGCGSRFTITLPATVAAHNPLESSAEPALRPPLDLTDLRVLIVEDDQLSRQALQELLQSWGCIVRAAANGDEAQHLLKEEVPGVIVSDYRLGDAEHGIALISRLRKLAGQQIPACIISGDLDAGLMFEVNRHGLTLLHKPVRPAKLRALIRRLTQPAEGGAA